MTTVIAGPKANGASFARETSTSDALMGVFGLKRSGAAIELPIKTVAGQNAREHHMARARRVKSERTAACLGVKSMRHRPELPVTVRLVRLSPGTLDDDNLQGAFKAIRDGVADAYSIPDNDPRIRWQYDQERCKRGCYGIRIEIEVAA